MRITKRQLRRIIREAITLSEGYMVPEFPNTDSMFMFIEELDPDDEVENDVIDPESGELMIPGGETPRDQPWFEEVAEEIEETPEPDDYEYDWAAEEARLDAQEEAQRQHDAEMEEKVRQNAIDAGMDWAGDTYYDAKNNPSMWTQYNAETAEDYVMAFAQDAAVDLADSVVKYGDTDVVEWFKSHPIKEPSPYARLQTIQTYLRDSVADMVMDGVSQGIEKQKKAA